MIGSKLYIFDRVPKGGVYENIFEVYSMKTKVCKKLKLMDNQRINFSVCSFMNCVYFIGGYSNADDKYKAECYKYESMNDNWRQIASLHEQRCLSACSVYEGKIVVTGGCSAEGHLKSV